MNGLLNGVTGVITPMSGVITLILVNTQTVSPGWPTSWVEVFVPTIAPTAACSTPKAVSLRSTRMGGRCESVRTTWDVQNPVNHGINYLSAGAGFQPRTVSSGLIRWFLFDFHECVVSDLWLLCLPVSIGTYCRILFSYSISCIYL